MELLCWSAVLLRANFSLLEKKLKPLPTSTFDFFAITKVSLERYYRVEWAALKKPKDSVTFVTEPSSLRRC